MLVAGLRPDPLGELERSPDPLASKGGLLLKEGKGREGKERKAFCQINICHYTTGPLSPSLLMTSCNEFPHYPRPDVPATLRAKKNTEWLFYGAKPCSWQKTCL